MGRFNCAVSQFAFASASGSPCVTVAKRTSPLTELSRMMRAWLASADAIDTVRTRATRRTKNKGRNSLREVISHPKGELPKSLDGCQPAEVAQSRPKRNGLACGCWRQVQNKGVRSEVRSDTIVADRTDDSHCLARFAIEWRRRAGRVLARQGTRTRRPFGHSPGTG